MKALKYILSVLIALTVLPVSTFINTPNLYNYLVSKKPPENIWWNTHVSIVNLVGELNGTIK